MRSMINASDEEMDAAFAAERESNSARAAGTVLDENIRLVLQCAQDTGGEGGWPMWLNPGDAVAKGYMRRIAPPPPGGVVKYEMTTAGVTALREANAALGDKATRYVHDVKYFGILEPVVYGYPFLWPLSAPTRRINGALVADRRVGAKLLFLLRRIFQ